MPIYMKYDSALGDDTLPLDSSSGWVEVQSFSWGSASAPSTYGGGGGAGKLSFSDFKVTKKIDSASVQLIGLLFSGKVDSNARSIVIWFVKSDAGGTPYAYLGYQLSDTIITGYQIDWGDANAGDSADPVETIDFEFQKIDIQYYKEQTGIPTQSAFEATYSLIPGST